MSGRDGLQMMAYSGRDGLQMVMFLLILYSAGMQRADIAFNFFQNQYFIILLNYKKRSDKQQIDCELNLDSIRLQKDR